MGTHKLYGLLAEALARLTFDFVEHPQPPRAVEAGHVAPLRVKAGDSGWGRLLSAYTQAGFILKELGVLELTGGYGRSLTWRYLIDGDAVFDSVSTRVQANQHPLPSIAETAEAWVLCVEQLGINSTSRMPFLPHDDMRPLMIAFTEHGYARQIGQEFLWTDKIGDIMRAANLWTEDNLSAEEVLQRATEVELALALKTVPNDVRRAALNGNVIAVYAALSRRWRNGKWQKEAINPHGVSGDIQRAMDFVEMIANGVKSNSVH